MKILVTGATGYVGGRLVPELLKRRKQVRVLVRDRKRIVNRSWTGSVEVVEGDLNHAPTVEKALKGIGAAFYLIHSMRQGKDFQERDRRLARIFAAAANHIEHVIYLGGLLPGGKGVSPHLRSRAEVGEILRETGRTTEFRAGPVIGSGSASFEMVRYLTERLPVMVTPRWIFNPVQTIALQDVLLYLVGALDRGPMGIIEIGSEPVTFREMMRTYARVRGLRRLIIPTPLLLPGLASHWVGWVTPVPNSMARPIIKGVTRPVLADTQRAGSLFPEIKPVSYENSVRRALEECRWNRVETRWCDSFPSQASGLIDREGVIQERRTEKSAGSRQALFGIFSGLGGDRGWLVWKWAWRIRGFLDRMAGGPGLRRGRRHPSEVRIGDAVDFWRVEDVVPGKSLLLKAEMRLPGKAWLQWEARPADTGSLLVQTARFLPRGLGGVLYWYLLFPVHKLIFRDLARAIVRESGKDKKTR